MKNKLKDDLKSLYGDMLKNNTFENVCTFCLQWGDNFPKDKNTGILFVGKAVNGWITDETDIEVLFGDSDQRIFARGDQMKWVHDLEGGEKYNTKKSAFWRVIKKISQIQYPQDWYSHIAWSNLCKLAPFEGGNPNNALYYEQLEYCQKIIQKEIEVLSPKVVVLFTSGWEKDFLLYLNDNNPTKSEIQIDWNGYVTKLYKIKNTTFIATPHPQGKDEMKHVEIITKLINEHK